LKLILNEKKMLDNSLENGYIDNDKPSNTIRTLVKHYFSIGMNKPQIYDSVDKFFELNFPDYNRIKWQKSIEGMIKYTHKTKNFELLDVNKVEITENELSTIVRLSNKKLEKLAFTLLVYAKIYNQLNEKEDNWVNEEHKYIFSDAKIIAGVKDQGKMIHNLRELGLVGSSVMVSSTNIKVNYADLESPVVLVISDFRNYVYEYLKWKGENIINCEECGILFYPSNNKQRACKQCQKDNWREYNAEKQREYRQRV